MLRTFSEIRTLLSSIRTVLIGKLAFSGQIIRSFSIFCTAYRVLLLPTGYCTSTLVSRLIPETNHKIIGAGAQIRLDQIVIELPNLENLTKLKGSSLENGLMNFLRRLHRPAQPAAPSSSSRTASVAGRLRILNSPVTKLGKLEAVRLRHIFALSTVAGSSSN